ncbi:MAG: hypothetical protein IT232_04145 [Flavobacteriales bacterium]|nr:hypothetical protein [Flavobacteriales bacterium]
MCNVKTLTENHRGYIAQCLKCNRIVLRFETTHVELKKDDFFDFHLQVRNLIKRAKNITDKNSKCFHLSTFSENSKMVLTHYEIVDLSEMLSAASNMLVVYDLLYKKEVE